MATLLIATVLLPMLGAALVAIFPSRGPIVPRTMALLITLVTAVLACILLKGFVAAPPPLGTDFAAVNEAWLPADAGIDIRFALGIDGVSAWMFGLSAILMITAVLVSWEAIQDRPALFYAMLLLLEAGCLGVFAARDIILFYVFFEFTLIPLFFLIGIWGSEDRRYAASKFFIYTLAGSLLTFLGLLSIVFWNYQNGGALTFSIRELTAGLTAHPMAANMQLWVFLALFAGFAIKVPLFPFHTWLPLAHVQAPTAGSVILAGIMLKMGTYGFVRFSIPMLPDATVTLMPWLLWLSVIGIVYGAMVALAQTDVKRLIAYSSVSHLGFCTLGLFALNRVGTEGAMLQMVNHGISTGGLFAIVGMMYERYHTREIKKLGGIARQTPWLAFFMLLFTFSSIGLPGMNGFAGEILILLGMFQRGWSVATTIGGGSLKVVAVLAISGVVLGAWYMLWLVQRVFFGPSRTDGHHDVHDLTWREIFALLPLAILVFWIGLYPKFFLDPVGEPLNQLTQVARSRLVGAAEPGPDADAATVAFAPLSPAPRSPWAELTDESSENER
jgi:NADH-quinone oxidoreductase subunit M